MVPELGNDGEVLLTIEAIFGIWGNEVTVADAGHRRGRSRLTGRLRHEVDKKKRKKGELWQRSLKRDKKSHTSGVMTVLLVNFYCRLVSHPKFFAVL